MQRRQWPIAACLILGLILVVAGLYLLYVHPLHGQALVPSDAAPSTGEPSEKAESILPPKT